MLLRATKKDPKILMKAGMACLLVFFLSNYVPHRTAYVGDDLFDGVRGALMGAGMALVLWSVYLTGTQRRNGAAR